MCSIRCFFAANHRIIGARLKRTTASTSTDFTTAILVVTMVLKEVEHLLGKMLQQHVLVTHCCIVHREALFFVLNFEPFALVVRVFPRSPIHSH